MLPICNHMTFLCFCSFSVFSVTCCIDACTVNVGHNTIPGVSNVLCHVTKIQQENEIFFIALFSIAQSKGILPIMYTGYC
mgnify:CR=1 FL=1